MARRLEIEIVGDASKLNKELAATQKSTSSFASKFGKLAVVGAGVGAGIAVAGVALKKTAEAAMESEKAQARLRQAMKGAGLSMEKYGGSIQKNIDKTSRLAALDDEDLSDSFAKLVRATGDVTRATEGMNLAADIARARNISLEAATKMVERAQIGNAAAFSRVGVAVVKSSDNLLAAKKVVETWRDSSGKLTEAEKQKAKALFDSARELDKQATAAKAFEEAQKKFAGGAEEYGKTSAAAQERLSVAFENLQEIIGAKVLPILAKLTEKLVALLDWVIVNWPRFSAEFDKAMVKVKAAFDFIRPIFDAAVEQVKNIARLVKAIVQGDWSEAWAAFKDVVAGAFRLLKEIFTLQLTVLKEAAILVGKAILEGIKEGILGVGAAAFSVINNIKSFAEERLETITGWGKSIGDWVVSGILDAFKGLGQKIWNAIKDALDFVRDKAPSLPKLPDLLPGANILGGPGGGRTAPAGGGLDLKGASPVMMPFAVAAQGMGLSVSSGLRGPRFPGDNSDHMRGKALDLVGPSSSMAAFFKSLVGNGAVRQAFYDPLGSIFGGKWNSYREGGHSDHVHVATYDQGGVLRPGWTMAYNGTGRNEYVSRGDAGPYYLVLPDGKVLAELVRSENVKYARRNA